MCEFENRYRHRCEILVGYILFLAAGEAGNLVGEEAVLFLTRQGRRSGEAAVRTQLGPVLSLLAVSSLANATWMVS